MDKELINTKKKVILRNIEGFANAYLDKEYFGLCEKVLLKLSRKREVPFIRGDEIIWAASIVWVIVRANFLQDKTQKYHITGDILRSAFGINMSTVGQKATIIERLLKIQQFDNEYLSKEMQKNNPFNELAISSNGFIFFK